MGAVIDFDDADGVGGGTGRGRLVALARSLFAGFHVGLKRTLVLLVLVSYFVVVQFALYLSLVSFRKGEILE